MSVCVCGAELDGRGGHVAICSVQPVSGGFRLFRYRLCGDGRWNVAPGVFSSSSEARAAASGPVSWEDAVSAGFLIDFDDADGRIVMRLIS